MRNIWVKTNKKKINVFYIVSIIVYMVVCIMTVITIESASLQSDKNEIAEVTNIINRTITLCYATEGTYPANIDYLKVHYGLDINEEKYIVHYEIFASNIPPEIKVFKIK